MPRTVIGGKRAFVPFFVSVFVVVADQVSKAVIVRWLGPGTIDWRYDLIGSWLALEYVENTGAAFGVLAGRAMLLTALAMVVTGWFVMTYWRRAREALLPGVATGLILGGAVGNVIDRVRLGYVVDFVAVGTFPRFNVADSAITVGVALIALFMLRDQQHSGEPDREQG